MPALCMGLCFSYFTDGKGFPRTPSSPPATLGLNPTGENTQQKNYSVLLQLPSTQGRGTPAQTVQPGAAYEAEDGRLRWLKLAAHVVDSAGEVQSWTSWCAFSR